MLRHLELWLEYRESRSIRLRNQLVKLNLGLVHKYARRYSQRSPEPFEDLCQIGALGLIKAVERFDPTKGNQFSSFATPWINGAIQHHERDKGQLVRSPRRELEQRQEIERKAKKLGVSVFEAGESFGYSMLKVQDIFLASSRFLFSEISEAKAPDDSINRAELQKEVIRAIASLPRVSCEIVKLYAKGTPIKRIASTVKLSEHLVLEKLSLALGKIEVKLQAFFNDQ